MNKKSLESICIDILLKGCDLNYSIERINDTEILLYCLLDELLTGTCGKVFYFCQCPNW